VLVIGPTLYIFLLAMALFPEVQKNIQEEIERIVGSYRLPRADDESNMPYTEAVFLEVFRYFTPGALAFPMNTIRECTYRNYNIPKGTMVSGISR